MKNAPSSRKVVDKVSPPSTREAPEPTIGALQVTLRLLRSQLDDAVRAKEEAVRVAVGHAMARNRQLKDTIRALRRSLEQARAEHEQGLKQAAAADVEIRNLRSTLQEQSTSYARLKDDLNRLKRHNGGHVVNECKASKTPPHD